MTPAAAAAGGPAAAGDPAAAGYRDRWISCSPDGVSIRGYYFPWGTKRIPYAEIRSVRRVDMGAFTGRGRIWGTSNPRYWASLDPQRPSKRVGFVLDVGGFVRPLVTPDDPDAFEAVVRRGAGLGPAEGGAGPAPIV